MDNNISYMTYIMSSAVEAMASKGFCYMDFVLRFPSTASPKGSGGRSR
ncbi:MAG: hypothetical protein HKN31_13050 [Pricia sp.]|nr:hypothetical protein [Pricia sp.]